MVVFLMEGIGWIGMKQSEMVYGWTHLIGEVVVIWSYLDRNNSYHHYRRNERGYLLHEFNKAKTHTFDGELKELEHIEAWLLGMKNLFKLHVYT